MKLFLVVGTLIALLGAGILGYTTFLAFKPRPAICTNGTTGCGEPPSATR